MIASHRLYCYIPEVIIVENVAATFVAMSGVSTLSILTTSDRTQRIVERTHDTKNSNNINNNVDDDNDGDNSIRENKKYTLHSANVSKEQSGEKSVSSSVCVFVDLM